MILYKLLLFSTLSLLSISVYADTLDKDGILRKDDGSVRYLTHFAAMTACPAGTHLPRIREWAEFAVLQGAIIYDTKPVFDGYVAKDPYMIEAVESDWTTDKFYYSYGSFESRYQKPQGDLGKLTFWSSSTHPNDMQNSYIAYTFSGEMGYLMVDNITYNVAVRCIKP